jgi:hypothetical protein
MQVYACIFSSIACGVQAGFGGRCSHSHCCRRSQLGGHACKRHQAPALPGDNIFRSTLYMYTVEPCRPLLQARYSTACRRWQQGCGSMYPVAGAAAEGDTALQQRTVALHMVDMMRQVAAHQRYASSQL